MTIEPYVVIGSKVKIGNNVIIKSFSHLENCKIENKVEIGPYARIRPGTTLKEGSKIGNFVEIKKSTLGKKSKVNHLTYIGDTSIGKSVNVGAGTITCNYDGIKKYKTRIKDNVFIGSNSSLEAPITLAENSIVGAGSVILTAHLATDGNFDSATVTTSLFIDKSNQSIIVGTIPITKPLKDFSVFPL